MSSLDFISVVAPLAIELRLEGSPIFPSVRIAQAGLETGWTIHSWNNLVGFKVGSRPPNNFWKGAYVNKGTWEVYDGKRTDVVAAFRAYDSIEDCFRDQDELFKLPRYDRVRATKTPEEQAMMLQLCGYATDPAYPGKIVAIINSSVLRIYDKEAVQGMEMIKQLQKEIESLQDQVKVLEAKQSMPVPSWAKTAIDAAVKAEIVDTPNGGSYDFYRVITVLHRKGLI